MVTPAMQAGLPAESRYRPNAACFSMSVRDAEPFSSRSPKIAASSARMRTFGARRGNQTLQTETRILLRR